MEISKIAKAGSAESNDILIMISPADDIEIELESIVKKQYGEDILKVIEQTLKSMGVKGAHIIAQDKGALDFTIRARVKSAVMRGADN